MNISMVGHLRDLVLASYRTPAESVRHLIPEGLQLMTRERWAFWSVAVCRVEDMRPRGLPAWCGLSYFHVGYRLFVTARTADGVERTGLFFVRSEADRAWARWGGNAVTPFRFNPAVIRRARCGEQLAYTIAAGGHTSTIVVTPGSAAAPDSCFDDAAQAARWLAYRPVAFSVRNGHLRLAEVHRDEAAWHEHPAVVKDARWAYLEQIGQQQAVLERATHVDPIAYRWHIGRELPLAAPVPRGEEALA